MGDKGKSSWKIRKKYILWVGVILVLILLLFTIRVPFYIVGFGNVMSERDAILRAGVKGPIKKILVSSGDKVKEGDVIIQLEDSYQSVELLVSERRLSEAIAELNRLKFEAEYKLLRQQSQKKLAEIALKDALREYNMVKELFSKKAASKNELEKAYLMWELAKAKLEDVSIDQRRLLRSQIKVYEQKISVLKASVELARASLELRKVRAPIGGVVVIHTLSTGQVVDANQILGQIFTTGGTRIVAKVSEKYLWFVRPGKKLIAEASAYPHRVFGYIEGVIKWVSPVVNPNSSGDGSVIIKAEVQKVPKGVKLKPGQSARIWIEAGKVPLIYYVLGLRKFSK